LAKQELKMRIAKMIFAGSVAALVATTPALAKNAESRTSEDKPTTSASCHAYQQAADGSWTQLPCQEPGGAQTQHKSAAKGAEAEQR
jgi:hypothetical protein